MFRFLVFAHQLTHCSVTSTREGHPLQMQVQLSPYEAKIASVYKREVDTTLSQSHRSIHHQSATAKPGSKKETKSQANNFEQLAINSTS